MKNKDFGETVQQFIDQDGRRIRQLAAATKAQFGKHNQVANSTISRWYHGKVKKPSHWRDVVKLAVVLRLNEQDTNQLLAAAGRPPLASLRPQLTKPIDQALREKLDELEQTRWFFNWRPPFQLPPRPAVFVGRDTMLTQLKARLVHQPRHDYLCLLGMGGTGKTTIATELAYQLRSSFPDGVLWATLSGSGTMSILQGFAAAYGDDVSSYTDVNSRSGRVRSLLADKQVLIILDDAGADEEVQPLLPPTGAGAVVVTTRRHDLAVTDAAYRVTIRPFIAPNTESLALFQEILGKSSVQQAKTAFLQIADALGHLPLALTIAAHRIKHEPDWSAAEFLRRISQAEKRWALLKRGSQNTQISLDLSYQALPPPQRRFFRALCALPQADFSPEAAVYAADLAEETAADMLRTLFNLSMVQTGKVGRYQLHPLLRDYGRTQHIAPFIPRVITFYVNYILTHQDDYYALDRENDNLSVALQMAHERRLFPDLVRGVVALCPYLQTRGLYDQAKRHLEHARSATGAMQDIPGLTAVLNYLGRIASKQGEAGAAQAYYKEALKLARQINNNHLTSKLISELLSKLGAAAYRQGHMEEAKRYYEEAMSAAADAGDQQRIAILLTNLGLLAANQGDYAQAETYYQQGIELARQLGTPTHPTVILLQNLGHLNSERGDYAQATSYYEEGLILTREVNDPELTSRMLGNIGSVSLAMGNYTAAAAKFKQGFSLAEKYGLAVEICRQQANLGQVETERGRYDKANQHYHDALEQARQNDYPLDICVVQNLRGESLWLQKMQPAAAAAFQEGRQIAQENNFRPELAKSLFGLARIAARRGNSEAAHDYGQESYTIFTELGHKKAEDVLWWLRELPGVDLEIEDTA